MKFIIIDPTEKAHLPDNILAQSEVFVGLEKLTGADMVITPSQIPVNDQTIKIHVNKGLSIQRKKVSDLAASFMDNDTRIWRQLVRLRMLCELPWLMVVGDIKARKIEQDDRSFHKAVVDGRDTDINYFAVIGALDAWQRHGGYITWLSRDSLMLDWCCLQHNHLCKKEKNGSWGTTLIRRGTIKPLELISDIETTISTFPNIGVEKARAIYEKAKETVPNPNLMDCLLVLQNDKVDGIGDGIRQKAMRFIGWQK